MKTKDWIIIVLSSILLVILYLTYNGYQEYSETSKSLYEENRILRDSIRSIDEDLRTKELMYDSLKLSIKSSSDRHDSIRIKYKVIRDSIKYLNSDESILFLKKKLSHEMEDS